MVRDRDAARRPDSAGTRGTEIGRRAPVRVDAAGARSTLTRLGSLTVLALVLVVPALASPAAEAAGGPPTCGERTPTITGAGRIVGTEGDDVIVGSAGRDRIDGRGGRDFICAEGGRDTVYGGEGDDWIDGGPANDRLDGGVGTDYVGGGDGDDTCRGGLGDDSRDGSCERQRGFESFG